MDEHLQPLVTVASGLPLLLIVYFSANPEEEMTASDICVKWDLPKAGIHAKLRRLIRTGFLKSRGGDENDSRILFYSAGDALFQALRGAV